MLGKVVLVVYLLTGRSDFEILYTVKYPTEAACKVEAAKQTHSNAFYPIQRAKCSFDMTKEK